MSGLLQCLACGERDPDQFAPSQRRPGTRCRPCHTAYMRDYRAANPAAREKDRRQIAAYRKAEVLLRERHRAEFEALYAAELERADDEQMDAVLRERLA